MVLLLEGLDSRLTTPCHKKLACLKMYRALDLERFFGTS
jgi:hypothetical protein